MKDGQLDISCGGRFKMVKDAGAGSSHVALVVRGFRCCISLSQTRCVHAYKMLMPLPCAALYDDTMPSINITQRPR